MDNLVIGETSQISKYFPKDYLRISSRNIDKNFIKNKKWNKIFLCFGESRKFIDDDSLHDKINFEYTLDLIHFLLPYAKNIVIYSTCELWNKYYGSIDLNTPFNFYETNYIKSKFKLTNHVLNNDFYKKVIIIFPFNFNSIYRSQDFLFGKIFNSIINKTKIEIGNTYFHRDIIHPKFVVEKSITAESHTIVGSGRLTFVNDFIRDLYNHFSMDYEEFVVEKMSKYFEYEMRNEYYLNNKKCEFSYNDLLSFTISDINSKII